MRGLLVFSAVLFSVCQCWACHRLPGIRNSRCAEPVHWRYVAATASTAAASDLALTKKVAAIVRMRICPEMAETFVGVSAAIITTRKEDRDILFLAAIDFDETSQVKTLEGAKDVAYWMCAEKAKGGWKLVGIVWTENNEIKLFSGTLLPP